MNEWKSENDRTKSKLINNEKQDRIITVPNQIHSKQTKNKLVHFWSQVERKIEEK